MHVAVFRAIRCHQLTQLTANLGSRISYSDPPLPTGHNYRGNSRLCVSSVSMDGPRGLSRPSVSQILAELSTSRPHVTHPGGHFSVPPPIPRARGTPSHPLPGALPPSASFSQILTKCIILLGTTGVSVRDLFHFKLAGTAVYIYGIDVPASSNAANVTFQMGDPDPSITSFHYAPAPGPSDYMAHILWLGSHVNGAHVHKLMRFWLQVRLGNISSWDCWVTIHPGELGTTPRADSISGRSDLAIANYLPYRLFSHIVILFMVNCRGGTLAAEA
ncbi:hypothetical protein FB45DRAFT_1096176 [Roridomyces roridus]|uniref:Uncharacterized protein n=1 Tax=Roridomyces roridus TaxID=1738132 RepID=A0AAD7BGF9_9AGAR|nr:hypothetical protein FB45DRAFT_1096176 [Roridomyces roridus]